MLLAALGSARRRSSPAVNIVVDGNSISAGSYSTVGTLDVHIANTPPWDSCPASLTHSGHAVSGASWIDMLGHGAEVDAAYDPDRVNVLVAWETINSLADGRSAAQVLTDLTAYTSARKATRPGWRILHVETIPYGGSGAWATFNANMATVDAAVRAEPAAYGFDATVSPRVAPAFDHDGTTSGPFAAYASYWHETGVPYIHPTDAGKAVITPAIAQAVADLAGL